MSERAAKRKRTGSPAPWWRAVRERDRGFDDRFVYAVSTTGVYCRPSCPSRRPRPEHVRFFGWAREAERAGYRACRRCHPDATDGARPVERRIVAACRFLEARAGSRPPLAEVAHAVGLSPGHLQRAFRERLGISPRAYADALRVEHLKAALRRGEAIAPALYGSGYGSSSRLYERVRERLGMTPGAYRRGAPGEGIRVVVTHSRLGALLVAATSRGVCAVRLGGGARELRAALRRELPHARFVPADETLRRQVQAIVAALDARAELPVFPMDVRATAFQRRVWEAIRAIPRGTTKTYGELARALGRPKAARAVARACATNPVPLLIPCHRVVPAAGGPGGYRLGPERKAALLALERSDR